MERTEVVVVGTGAVGSSALRHLAMNGVKVVGLDRFPPAHDRGSSHGETRVIRLAYFENPDYVPLLLRAFDLWEELEDISGRELYEETGLLQVGPSDGDVVKGARNSSAVYEIPIENLTHDDLKKRFPMFSVPMDMEAVFEERAGYLLVEECVKANLDIAVSSGAILRTGIEVTGWRPDGDGVVVDTDQGKIGADRLVIAAGSWSATLLEDLGLPLQVLRKPSFWYQAKNDYDVGTGCPVFFFDTPHGGFYGCPAVSDFGVKVAEHSGGDVIKDPLEVDRTLLQRDEAVVRQFLEAHLPGVFSDRLSRHVVCMTTMTPDGDFILDHHPLYDSVSYVAGLSGHGFKMSNVLGESVANYAMGVDSDVPVEFLAKSRLDKHTLDHS